MPGRHSLLHALSSLLILAGLATSPAWAQTPAPAWNDSAAMASATLTDAAGQPLRLADLRGKVVFIDFWGTWCRPCMAEMDSIRQLQAGLREFGNRVAFVFVSIKTDHFAADTAWLQQSGLTGRNYRWEPRNPEQYHAFFNSQNSKWWVPNTLVLDPAGNVARWTRGSGIDWSIHLDLFRKLAQPKTAAAG